ncbi:MAG: hypothetical protein WAW42_07925 [Candidatus Competibacteraceae bacterium]
MAEGAEGFGFSALAFSPSGDLYGWGSHFGLYRIDPITLRFTAIRQEPYENPQQIVAMQFTASGELIGIAPYRDDASGYYGTIFFKLDPMTGDLIEVGHIKPTAPYSAPFTTIARKPN